jgi:hypothetical protein
MHQLDSRNRGRCTSQSFEPGHHVRSGGNNLNCPPPKGAGYDGYVRSITGFWLAPGDYVRIGKRIGTLETPTLLVREGGHAVDEIGINVCDVLAGFESACDSRTSTGISTLGHVVGSQRLRHHLPHELDECPDLGAELLQRWLHDIGVERLELIARQHPYERTTCQGGYGRWHRQSANPPALAQCCDERIQSINLQGRWRELDGLPHPAEAPRQPGRARCVA